MAYKILIVDDERALCEMIRAFLAQAGYATATAGSCAEALTVFRAEQPDAVLLDVMLPDGNGFDLLRRLREAGDAPALFLSARDEDASRLRGLGLGHEELLRFMAREAGVGLNDGAAFGVQGRGFMRMNMATSRALIETALLQIEAAWRSRENRH